MRLSEELLYERYKPIVDFIIEAHKNQIDDDGEPHWKHCLQVAIILSIVTADTNIIRAGLLHDILEDTPHTWLELSKLTNERVADLVLEVSKNRSGYFSKLKSRSAILIKFADRLHNLSRMDSWIKERQQEYINKSKFWKDGKHEKNTIVDKK